MRIYITGAGGMVGSHLIDYYQNKKDVEIYATYFHNTVDLEDINTKGIHFSQLDLRDSKKVEDYIFDVMPDKIFHLAAQSFPVVSWKDPYYTMDVNVKGTVAIFESVKKIKEINPNYNPKIVVISSSAIYGDALGKYNINNLPKEDCEMLPLHPYGVSKVAEDLLCYQYYKNFNVDAVRVRLFNCTGARKIGDVTSDFVKRAILLKRNNDNKLVVGNLETLRALLDVRDLCNALDILSEKGVAPEAYNVCSSHIFKMDYVIECIEKVMGTKYQIIFDKKLFRPADEPLYAGNCDKIKALGWKEQYEFIDTVKSIVEYWSNKDISKWR